MIVQCDFDGTAIINNLSVLLREKFAHSDWRKIELDYFDGKLTVEQSNKLQYALIKEPKEKLQAFVRQHIEVRPGFLEFVGYCRDTDIPLVIVSSGLDFYIEPVLHEMGVPNLELHCGQTSFGKDGVAISYHDAAGNVLTEGFKKYYSTWLKQRGQNLVYLGDGLSDLAAACQADHVFAIGQLPGLLDAKSVPYHTFVDFYDLVRQLPHLQ